MEFTLSLGFHAPTWLIVALFPPVFGLTRAVAHSLRRSFRRLDQAEFVSPVKNGEMHQISASEKRN